MENAVRSNKELFKISKVVFGEAYMEGVLMNSGNQKDRIISQIEKNTKYIHRNRIFQNILGAIFSVIFDIYIIFIFKQFSNALKSISPLTFDWILFAFANSVNMIFFTKLIMILTFSLAPLLGIFSDNNAFKFIESLPLSNKERSRIILFAFYRSINIQLIGLLFGLPVVTTISYFLFGGSWLIIPVSIIMSFLNVLFGLSVMIIVSNYMANKVFRLEDTSSKKNIFRLIFSFSYIAIYLLVSMSMSYIPRFIIQLFTEQNTSLDIVSINGSLALIPYPFALSYMFGVFIMPPDSIVWAHITMVFLGFALFLFITVLLARKAFYTLALKASLNITRREKKQLEIMENLTAEDKRKQFNELFSSMKINSAEKAIRRKDLILVTRDFALVMYTIFPIILPIMGVFFVLDINDLATILVEWNGMLLIFLLQGIIFLVIAFTSTENESGNLMATLPLSQYYIYHSKKVTMVSILFISFVIGNIILLFQYPGGYVLILLNLIYQILTILYMIDYVLSMYGFALGRFKGKYRLQVVSQKYKTLKIILIGAGMFEMLLNPILFEVLVFPKYGLEGINGLLILVAYAAVLALLFKLLSRKIYPKPK